MKEEEIIKVTLKMRKTLIWYIDSKKYRTLRIGLKPNSSYLYSQDVFSKLCCHTEKPLNAGP